MATNPFTPKGPYSPADGFIMDGQNTPLDAGALFNERGYNKANQLSIDSEEIINDFNGTLGYKIPLYNFKGPGDLRADLSLTYNSQVNHTMISADELFATSTSPYVQYNYGFPQWILNLNGVAIQALSFETNMYTKQTDGGASYTTGNLVRCLLNGYHLTQEMQRPDISSYVYDKIYLLQGDGSIDSLINGRYLTTDEIGDEITEYTIGNYISLNKGQFSRAKVEWLDSQDLEIDPMFNLRRMYYMKGDGITYIYEEIHNQYLDQATSIDVKIPKIFLLKSIKDRYGNTLELEYLNMWPPPSFDPLVDPVLIPGRPLLSKIKCNWDRCTEIEFKYDDIVSESNPKILIKNTTDGDFELKLDQKILFGADENHIARITSIKNPVNQIMSITYYNYERKMIDMFFGDRVHTEAGTLKVYMDKLQRIKKVINYFGGETSYEYTPFYNNVEEIMFMGQTTQKIQSVNDNNFRGQGRDIFFVNMLSKKEKKIGSEIIQTETYIYEFILHRVGGITGRLINPIQETDEYITTKIIESTDDTYLFSTPKKIKLIRGYKAYKTLDYQSNFANKDYSAEIKLSSEASYAWDNSLNNYSAIPYVKRELTYFLGPPTLVGVEGKVFAKGSFLVYTDISKFPTDFENIVIDSRFFYDHYSQGESSGWFVQEAVLNPVKQITKLIPVGNSNKTIQNFNFIYRELPTSELPFLNGKYNPTTGATQEYDDNKYFYLNNLKVYESTLDVFGNGKIESFSYQPSTDERRYIGQLYQHSIINENNSLDKLNTSYVYARKYRIGRALYTPQSIMPSIEGNLIEIITPNGNRTKFHYHPIEAGENSAPSSSIPEISGIVALDNSSTPSVSQQFQDRRFPTRTDKYPQGETNYPIKSYELRDSYGNSIQTISPNDFISASRYDKINRILKFTTPYDFSTTDLYANSQKYTFKYDYDDTSKSATMLSKLLGSTDKKIEYDFDSFYRLIHSKLFTDETHFNQYDNYYNYLNQSSKTTDPSNYSTEFSYEPWEKLKLTKFADDSISIIQTTYNKFLKNYEGLEEYPMYIKIITFIDEELNKTEKFYDALENLRREIKYVKNERDDGELVDVLIPFKALQTDYYYDAIDRLIKVITPSGKEIKYEYDGFGRLIKKTTPDSGSTKYLYDNDSNLIYSQNAQQAISIDNPYNFYSYDKANRLLGIGEAGIPLDGYPNFDYVNPDETYFFQEVNSSDAPAANLYDYLIYNVYDDLSNCPFGFLYIPSDYDDINNYTMGLVACTAFRTRKSDNWNFKYYRYDAKGRVIRMWIILDDLEVSTIDFKYNSMNQILFLIYNGAAHANKKFKYIYDDLGRLINSELEESGPPPDPDYYLNLANYSYNDNSLVSSSLYNNFYFTVNNEYDNRNRLTRIIVIEPSKVFDYILEYYRNSNVQSQKIGGNYNDNFSDSSDIGSKFIYDSANRLKKTELLSISDYININIVNSYDSDGNLLKMTRNYNGDDFDYTYYTGTNKLKQISGSDTQFIYDFNGNVVTDLFTKNSNMLYDFRNLLIEVKSKIEGESATYYYTRYWYDDDGNRVKKLVLISYVTDPSYPDWNDPTSGDWSIYQTNHYVRNYLGKQITQYKDGALDFYNIWGLDLVGKIKSDNSKLFYIKDHLGSIRVVLDESNTIVSAIDYDSWGNMIRVWQPNIEYKFSTKERDFENTYDYFGARNLSARIGRWIQTDPLFEKHIDLTPYNFVLNNPLTLIDPDGRQETNPSYKPGILASFVPIPPFIFANEQGENFLKGSSRSIFGAVANKLIDKGIEKDSEALLNSSSFAKGVTGGTLKALGKIVGVAINLFVNPDNLGKGSFHNGAYEFAKAMQEARVNEAMEKEQKEKEQEESKAKSEKAKTSFGSDQWTPKF